MSKKRQTISIEEANERIENGLAKFLTDFKGQMGKNLDMCPNCQADITEYVFKKDMRRALAKMLMKHYVITP